MDKPKPKLKVKDLEPPGEVKGGSESSGFGRNEGWSTERWRGHVDSQLHETRKDVDSIWTKLEHIGDKVDNMSAKVAIFATIGSFAGTIVTSVIVALLFKWLTK